ncbi:MAG: ribonuclease R [Clostridiales bacterium]|jgi:ribonuclease R|nr:ribonuclease R [Clostridiales bacterium]
MKKKNKFKNTKSKQKKFFKKNTSALCELTGVVQCSTKGFAFLIVKDGNDVFIPQRNLHSAMHGDTVTVQVCSTDRGLEGKVKKIVHRCTNSIVGVLQVFDDNFAVVVPDDKRYGNEFVVLPQHRKTAKNGDKVVLGLSWSNGFTVKVTEVLGQVDTNGVDILSIIREHGLREEFEKKTMVQASEIAQIVSESEIKNRQDFRNQLVIAIDSEDTKDIDDAVSVVKTERGFLLYVHIADVAHYVEQNSQLDKEAERRGTSVYFAGSVLPMLPKPLSNGICSLNPDVDRLTLTVMIDIDSKGDILKSAIYQSVIKAKQLTYSQVTSILNGSTDRQFDTFRPMINDMAELTKILAKKRIDRGSIDFDLHESKIVLDKDGNVVDIFKRPREYSHKIVEEFMLMANQVVAKTFLKLKTPFVFRVHLAPDQKKMENLLYFLKSFGLTIHGDMGDIKPKNIADMLSSIPANIAAPVNNITLKSQMKATYESKNKGHFGLALAHYCHFTSPIRRYPDLMIHRIIKAHLNSQDTKKFASMTTRVAIKSSQAERTAIEVERKVEAKKKAQFMQNKIGQQFEGTLSGVTVNGVFVELENTVEGFVRLQDLPKDNYIVDERLLTVIGKQHRYTIGHKIKIVVHSVVADKINFKTVI